MASAMIGNLAVSLTMETAAFQRGATIAEKRVESMRGRFAAATTSVKGLGAAIGVGLGADVLYRITSSAFEMASGLAEAAEQTGLTVEGLQELRYAAEQTGVGADKVEATMKRLSKSLGDLEMGKKSTVAAFEAIGLSADDLRGKRPDEALRLIADQLNKLPDAASRVAIGQQLMGRGFSDLLPLINGGSAALDQYAETSRKNGQISTEDAAKLDELADSWGTLKTRVGVATANIIAAVIPMVENVVSGLNSTRQAVHDFREGVIQLGRDASSAVINMVTSIGEWIGGKLNAIWQGALNKINQVRNAFRDLEIKVTKHSYIPDMVSAIGDEMGSLGRVMVRPALDAVRTVSDAFFDLVNSVKSGGFLDILGSVIGAGLQLGGLGLFGNKIQGNIMGAQGGFVGSGRSSGRAAPIQIVPSPYFDVVVDGRVMNAAPSIAQAGGQAGVARIAHMQSRRLA